MSFVTVAALDKSYRAPTQTLRVLRGLDLSVERGEMVAIVGASGVGKSTLLHVLGGLDRFEAGSIRIGDADLSSMTDAECVAFRNRHIGFVFQFHHLLPEFDALENTEMPLRIARLPVAEARAAAEALLRRVGLGDRLGHRPGTRAPSLSAARRRAHGRPRRADRGLVARPASRNAPRAAAHLDHRHAQSPTGGYLRPGAAPRGRKTRLSRLAAHDVLLAARDARRRDIAARRRRLL
jgi:lipoprotein-releasing system ATP-binding protein